MDLGVHKPLGHCLSEWSAWSFRSKLEYSIINGLHQPVDEENDIRPGIWDFGWRYYAKGYQEVVRVQVIDLANEKGDHARAHVPHKESAGDPDT